MERLFRVLDRYPLYCQRCWAAGKCPYSPLLKEQRRGMPPCNNWRRIERKMVKLGITEWERLFVESEPFTNTVDPEDVY